jgi:hypothetical protein
VRLVDWSDNGRTNKTEKISLEQLMVSTLAMTDATVKLLIAKGVFTDDEFKAQLEHRAGELYSYAETASLKIAPCLLHCQLASERNKIVFCSKKSCLLLAVNVIISELRVRLL